MLIEYAKLRKKLQVVVGVERRVDLKGVYIDSEGMLGCWNLE
jgi:hypothetical protein